MLVLLKFSLMHEAFVLFAEKNFDTKKGMFISSENSWFSMFRIGSFWCSTVFAKKHATFLFV